MLAMSELVIRTEADVFIVQKLRGSSAASKLVYHVSELGSYIEQYINGEDYIKEETK